MVEPLAILVLPCRLEEFEYEAHARELLEIPRVLAVEPRRANVPGMISEVVATGQAKRLRLPGRPRLIVLYGPHQYPLARAIGNRHAGAELWYASPDPASDQGPGAQPDEAREGRRLADFDQLARRHAANVIRIGEAADTDDLVRRLNELEVVNTRPFNPRRFRPRLRSERG